MLLNFHSGLFRFFLPKNRKSRENVVTARAESILLCMAKCFLCAFVIVSLTFYSSMRQSKDTGCASSSDADMLSSKKKKCGTARDDELSISNFHARARHARDT